MNQSSREKRLHDALTEALLPAFITLENESNRHQRPGTDTHFKVTLVSEAFEPLSRIERHRKVNAICVDEFSTGLHALSLHLYTPEEWKKRAQQSPKSPFCKNTKTA